jgi:heterodisulfide reductase subunit A
MVDIAIVGGGISGVQSAIELADLGYNVIIIEKNSYLGGNAAKLGKFFPTNDCALCVMASKEISESSGFRKCFYRSSIESHPRIKILTNSQITQFERENNKFKLKILENPRYVNENCINCGKCETVCPNEIKNEFNFGFDRQKVIHLPMFQAIPRRYIIDRDFCGDCKGPCEEICPEKAIDLNDSNREILIEAKSILISTGFEEFSQINRNQYGYKNYDNVITQLQLARLLDPTGPTFGQIISPETGEPVKTVSMILCVGSRDINNKAYCSKICCTYSLKHALMLREKGIEVKVFYIDIRTNGEYEQYFIDARESGVIFIRGKVDKIEQDPLTKKLIISAENTLTSESIEIEEELIVLTPALVPSSGTSDVIELFNIDNDEFGFIETNFNSFNLMSTNISGIFVAGSATGPSDVPSSIVQANAASMNIITFLKGYKEEVS